MQAVPSQPRTFTVSATGTVTFSAPASDGGSPVLSADGYTIEAVSFALRIRGFESFRWL